MKILLGDFNAKSGKEDILKTTIGSLHQDSNDSDVKKVYFATSKNLYVQSMMYLHLKHS